MIWTLVRIAMQSRWPTHGAVIFVLGRAMSVIYPPAPGFPMDLAAIRLFGPIVGFFYAECGIMLGASIAFSVAHAISPNLRIRLETGWMLRTHLRQHLPTGDMMPRKQFRKWLEIRLWTNPLFDPISYLAGMTRTAFWPYFWASFLGNLPSTFLFFCLEAEPVQSSFLRAIIVALMFSATVIYVAHLFLGIGGKTCC